MIRILHTALRLARARRGTVAAEFAVVGGFLSLLLVGVADYSLPLWRTIQLGNAARAGAAYAVLHSSAYSAATVQAAGASATQLTGLTVTPTKVCGCPNAAGSVTVATCGTNCGAPLTTSTAAGTYVTVTATLNYTPLMTFASLSGTLVLTASAVARIQ
jgi:Flp pilus assembly protein TadG